MPCRARALALLMEALQNYPAFARAFERGLGLNVAGALVGAVVGRPGIGRAIDHWSRFRERWFIADARGALVLLALWPFALLFPAAVPFGLGPGVGAQRDGDRRLAGRTPRSWNGCRFAKSSCSRWCLGAELICVALGAFIPCLLGYTGDPVRWRGEPCSRAAAIAVGVAATALSAALSWGPAARLGLAQPAGALGLLAGMVLASRDAGCRGARRGAGCWRWCCT